MKPLLSERECKLVAEFIDSEYRQMFPRPPEEWNTEEHVLNLMEFWIIMLATNVEKVGRVRALKLAKSPEDWSLWVDLSEALPLAWHTVQVAARVMWKVSPSVFLCSPLGIWAVEAGLGIRSKPSTPGPDPWKSLIRDAAIEWTIKEIVALGQRRATYPTEGGSACHKVAERFESRPKGHYGVRVPKSYDGVRRVWQNRPRVEK